MHGTYASGFIQRISGEKQRDDPSTDFILSDDMPNYYGYKQERKEAIK